MLSKELGKRRLRAGLGFSEYELRLLSQSNLPYARQALCTTGAVEGLA